MENNIIPQEDNTSEILKADILKYGYINRRNELGKIRTNANASKRQESAIRFLEKERNDLATELNVAMSKSKMKENDRYKAKFANLIRKTKQTEIELAEQRKIERELDKALLKLEIEVNKSKGKTSKQLPVCDGTTLTINANNAYNKLINEQNQLRTQVESLLKRWNLIQKVYNKLMNKLNKGKQIATILSEQVSKTYVNRNNAKERLEIYLQTSKTQVSDQEQNLVLLKRKLNDDVKRTEFLSQKLKNRIVKKIQKSGEDDTKVLALNAEAETFVQHLINIAEGNNLEKITEEIIQLDLDNDCMFQFLVAIDIHLTDAENAIARSRTAVADRTRALSDVRATKTEELANVTRAFTEGRAPLREVRRAVRLMAAEWRHVCDAMDDLCDLMAMDEDVRPPRLLRADDDAADDGDWPFAEVADVAAYFGPVDRRLDDILHRLFWAQDHRTGRDARTASAAAAAGESMSTGSEQEDDFLACDLDNFVNRHAKIMAAIDDQDAGDADVGQSDPAHVPSICPECLKKRNENQGKYYGDEMQGETDVNICQSQNVSLKTADDEKFKALFHSNSECPLYKPEKFQMKRHDTR